MPIRLSRLRLGQLIVAGLVCLGLYASWRVVNGASVDAPKAPQSVPVSVVFVERRDVPLIETGIGTVQSMHSVVLRPQVSGVVTEVMFVEGQSVGRGQLLARIDDRAIVAGLRQAEAEKASNHARLKAAKLDQSRYESLGVQQAVSRRIVEQQAALVEELDAAIAANDATIAAHKVQLSYTRIVSPVNGRIGMRHIDPGNLVQVGDTTGLATVAQIDPISVVFTLPQESLSALQEIISRGDKPRASAIDRHGGSLLGEGKLVTVDNQVDAATGMIRLRAEFSNRDGRLWPGQFVAVHLQTGVSAAALVVPMNAVKQAAQGPFVFRVRQGRAEVVRILLGYNNEDIAVIQSGLENGDSVVVDGHSRLTPNAVVRSVAKEVASSVGS